MPISPERQKLYPGGSIRSVTWIREFRAPVLERAGNRCEGTPQRPTCRAENGKPHPDTLAIVVLTIAHMDQDVGNNAWENLRALCQLCHNRWDQESRTRNAISTRRRKLGHGTLDLFACEAVGDDVEEPAVEAAPEPAPRKTPANAERLKARIAGLRAKTTAAGCTEAEATAAAEMAARLMAEHGLSEAEMVMTDASVAEPSSRANWRTDLASSIAVCTNTALILTGASVLFIGRAPGPDIAAYLQDLCVRAVERERRAFQASAFYRARRKAKTRRAASSDFTDAMVLRLRQRLHDLFRDQADEAAAAEARRHLASRFPNTTTTARSDRDPRFDDAAWAGLAAGSNTRLDPGISTGQAAPKHLAAPTA